MSFPFSVSSESVCCLAAAPWELGSKEHAEVVELTSLRSASVLGKRQSWPYQVHLSLMEFRMTLQECDV